MEMSSWASISSTSGSSLSWIPSLIELRGVKTYVLASTNWLISLVLSKLLHSILKAFTQTQQRVLLCLLWFCWMCFSFEKAAEFFHLNVCFFV